MNFEAATHARKIRKRERYNKILSGLRKPLTTIKLEILHGVTRNLYSEAIRRLCNEGYIQNMGVSDEKSRPYLWQAIKFDYREEGVDYDRPITAVLQDRTPEKPHTGLEQAHYVHNPNHSYYRKKYNLLDQERRKERKSPKVYAGILDY